MSRHPEEPEEPRATDSERSGADLVEMASGVADGRAIEWQTLLDSAPLPKRGALEKLRQVADLMSAFERVSLSQGDESLDSDEDEAPLETLPESWGHLRLIERLGSGSFGDVYRAFDSVLQRQVALKLRRGTAASDRAYIEEARRLARVRHRNVLAVHGADVHDGRVGLWAELLDGATLESLLLEAEPLSKERAVEIARSLAHALEAVHEAGLAHGDVKASNVMIEPNGAVVLMDFGAGGDTDSSSSSSPFGSPLSMPPEAFDGAGPSAAGDLYSLGVLFYRMLAGRYPVEAASLPELARKHRESDNTTPAMATVPRPLRALVAALLHRSPGERPSAGAVIETLKQVQEAPGRRRKRVALGLVMASLILGALAAGIGYLIARRSEDRARAAQAEAEAVNNFLYQVMASPRPTAGGRQVPMVEVLEQAEQSMKAAFSEQPAAYSRALHILGRTYLSLDRYEDSVRLLEKATALLDCAGPDCTVRERAEFAHVSAFLAQAFFKLGRIEEAEALLDRLDDEVQDIPRDHDVPLEIYSTRASIADARQDYAKAQRWLERLLEERPAVPGRDDPNRQVMRVRLAQVLLKRSEFAAAVPILEDVLTWSLDYHGERHSTTLFAGYNLARAMSELGRQSEAEPHFRRTLRIASEWLGPTDPWTAGAMDGLATNLFNQGRLEEAAELQQRCLDLAIDRLGPDHQSTLVAMGNQANILRQLGRNEEAEALLLDALERTRKTLGERDPLAFTGGFNLAELYYDTGRFQEALNQAQRVRQPMSETLGEEHLFTLVTDALRGAIESRLGAGEEAETLLKKSYEMLGKSFGEEHPQTLRAQYYLALHLVDSSRAQEAIPLLTDLAVKSRQALGEQHSDSLKAEALLGRAKSDLGSQ